MQEMVIYGVSFDMVGKQPIVLLKTVDGNKFLPIWIGHPEAAAILMKLQGATTPRPMTHDLLCDMLGELEVTLHAGRGHRAAREHLLRLDHARDERPRAGDRLAPLRRARPRRALRRADLRRRGGHRRVGDRVRARGRGHRGGRREVQGLPRPASRPRTSPAARSSRRRRSGRAGARQRQLERSARRASSKAMPGRLGGLRQQATSRSAPGPR